jgi:hypothetical protein
MLIPWYYMWSENYLFFRELLKDSIHEENFIIKEIYILQEKFDAELYKVEDKHFWDGSLLKVDAILNSLLEAKHNSNEYILFTDIDIIVKPGLYSVLEKYIDDKYDIVFFKEERDLNIGFMLLHVADSVITFWQTIREKMLKQGGLDQAHVNELIHTFPGKYTAFNQDLIACNNTWDGSSDFIVMQLLCSCLGKEFNMAEKIFNAAQYKNIEPYMKFVPDNIIPFIYKFQEILYHSYKEAKTAGIS